MNLPDFGIMTGVILALVEWLKETYSLEGKTVNVISLVMGLVFGSLYQLVQVTKGVPLPVDFNGWLTLVLTVLISGIGMGLTASGFYKVGSAVVMRAVQKSVQPAAGDVPPEVSHTPPEILEQFKNK